MVALNEELQKAVHSGADGPISVIDPSNNRVYVLISRDHYERLRPLLEDVPLSLSEQRQLLVQAGRRADWDAPEMDAYDNYDQARTTNP